jgi:hypothetical protein
MTSCWSIVRRLWGFLRAGSGVLKLNFELEGVRFCFGSHRRYRRQGS